VLESQVQSIAAAVLEISVTQQTYYRWRKQYGGMVRDQLRRLKELEKENLRLRRAAQVAIQRFGLRRTHHALIDQLHCQN